MRYGLWMSLMAAATVGASLAAFGSDDVAQMAMTVQPPRDSLPAPAPLSGAGVWREQGRRAEASRPWRVHMVRSADGEIRAKISLPGMPALDGAQIEAQVIGSEAFGVLLDDTGAQIATFNATVWSGRTGGSFIMGDGRSGVWEYDAGTKAEVLRLEAPADSGTTPAVNRQ